MNNNSINNKNWEPPLYNSIRKHTEGSPINVTIEKEMHISALFPGVRRKWYAVLLLLAVFSVFFTTPYSPVFFLPNILWFFFFFQNKCSSRSRWSNVYHLSILHKKKKRIALTKPYLSGGKNLLRTICSRSCVFATVTWYCSVLAYHPIRVKGETCEVENWTLFFEMETVKEI